MGFSGNLPLKEPVERLRKVLLILKKEMGRSQMGPKTRPWHVKNGGDLVREMGPWLFQKNLGEMLYLPRWEDSLHFWEG